MVEAVLQRLLLARLNAIDGVWCWRANTGAAMSSAGHRVHFGVPGQADISGILRGGRRLEVEVKSDRGRQSPEQREFQHRIEALGGLYLLAYELEPTLAAVRAALEASHE